MMSKPRVAGLLALFVAAASQSACSAIGVKPWERDLLAKPEMALSATSVDALIDEHVYFSKEAASGGRGFGGGGCGCN